MRNTDNVVLLMSSELLQRPWCAAEIVCAHKSGRTPSRHLAPYSAPTPNPSPSILTSTLPLALTWGLGLALSHTIIAYTERSQ